MVLKKSAMMGGGDMFWQILLFYVLWATWCAGYADTLLKQLVSEVTIFLSAAIGMLLMLEKQGILMRIRTSEALQKSLLTFTVEQNPYGPALKAR